MPRRSHTVFCLSLACAALTWRHLPAFAQPLAPAAQAPAPAVKTQLLEVDSVVRDAKGQPVVGAEIVLITRYEPAREAVTLSRLLGRSDAQGRFHLALDAPVEREAALEAGFDVSPNGDKSAVVLVYAAGFAPVRATINRRTPDVTLPTGATASGLVRDAQGQPVAGAIVRADVLTPPADGDGTEDQSSVHPENFPSGTAGATAFATRTDAEGLWTLRDLPPNGALKVALADPRFANDSKDVELGGAPEATVLTANPGARLSGRALYPDGKPAPDVRVLAVVNADRERIAVEGRTGDDGAFALLGLVAGEAELTFNAPSPDWAPSDTRHVTLKTGEETRAPDFKLERGVALTGRVLDDQTRQPVAKALVFVIGAGGETYSTRSDDQGLYSVHVTPGDHGFYIVLYPDEYVATGQGRSTDFEVKPTSRTIPDLTLHRGDTLSGTALDEAGQPATGATIVTGNGYYGPRAVVDEKGRWTLVGLQSESSLPNVPRRVHLSTQGNWSVVGTGQFEIGPNLVKLTLRRIVRTDVAARVMDADGQPVPGAKVSAKIAMGDGAFRFREFTSDARGAFVLRQLPPDAQIELTATKPGYVLSRSGGVEVGNANGGNAPGNNALQSRDVVLLALNAKITGRVVDAGGQPVAGALVSTLGNEGITQPLKFVLTGNEDIPAPKIPAVERIATTDAAGNFTLEGLRAGETRIGATHASDFGAMTTVVKSAAALKAGAAPDAPLTLALQRGATPASPTDWDAAFAYFAAQNPPAARWDYSWQSGFSALLAHDPERALALSGGNENPDRLSYIAGALVQLAETSPAVAAKWGRPYLDKIVNPREKRQLVLQFAFYTAEVEPQRARQTYDLYAANLDPTQLTAANADDLSYVAALAARLQNPDAEGWAQALAVVAGQLPADQARYSIVNYAKILAEGSPGLAQTYVASLPLNAQIRAWVEVIPTVARRDPALALKLLTQMEALVARPDLPEEPQVNDGYYHPTPKQSLNSAYQATAQVLLYSNPQAAYGLTLKMGKNDLQDLPLRVQAAALLPRDAALTALRAAYEVATAGFDATGNMARVAAAVMPLDAALGESYFDAARARLYPRDPDAVDFNTQSYGIEHYALYRAASNPAEARLLLENEWQRATTRLRAPQADKGDENLRDQQLAHLYRLVVPMAALDGGRAQVMLAEIKALRNGKAQGENYEIIRAQSRIFSWLVSSAPQRLAITLY